MPLYVRNVEVEERFLEFDAALRFCPRDGEPLRYSHQTSGRGIARLSGPVHAVSQTVYCTRGRCPLNKAVLHPVQELVLAPRGSRVGSDVIAWIGQVGFGEKLKRAQIRQRLREEHGLLLSETTIQNSADLYAALLSLANLEDPELIGLLKHNGVVVLSADGAKPIRGDDCVWFLRDVISGRTLAAEVFTSSRIPDLEAWLRTVRTFLVRHSIPVVGIVIDAEGNIQAAMENVFPDAPIQLCQFHYISNLAKPLGEHDRKVRKKLTDGMKGVGQIARDVVSRRGVGADLTQQQSLVLGRLLRGVQSVLRDTGKYPYKPGGLRMYDRLVEAERVVHEMRRRHKFAALLELEKLLKVVRKVCKQAEWLRDFYRDVQAMSDVLFADNTTGARVRREVAELRNGWEEKLAELKAASPDHPGVEVLAKWKGTSETYGDRLFTCYSHPHLPPTNNSTEQAISDLKQLARVLSGKPNPAVRFKRQGATLALFLNRSNLPGEHFINSRRPRDFELARRLLAARRRDRSVEYRARRDFTGLLNDLQEQLDGLESPQ